VVAASDHAGAGYFCREWDATTGNELDCLPAEARGPIGSLSIFPDGNTLVTTSFDHTVRVWDLAQHRRLALLQGHGAEVGASAVSPDGRLFVTGDRSGDVFAWSWPLPPDQEFVPEATQLLAFSPDGRTLAIVRAEKTVEMLDTGTWRPVRAVALDPGTQPGAPVVCMSADLQTLAQGLAHGEVKLWRGVQEPIVLQTGAKGPVEFLALSKDGDALAAGARGEQVRWLDLRAGGEPEVLPLASGNLVLSPDGGLLAVLPASKPDATKTWLPMMLWDLGAGTLRARLEVDSGVPFAAAFSPDGRVLATVGSDNAVSLWGTGTGVLLGRCLGHRQMVRAVAFTDAGRTVASAGDDGTVRLWNVTTQSEILSLENPGCYLRTLCFSPEGRALAVARAATDLGPDVRIYRAPLLEEAESDP
jgi:WD40 repeat protein